MLDPVFIIEVLTGRKSTRESAIAEAYRNMGNLEERPAFVWQTFYTVH